MRRLVIVATLATTVLLLGELVAVVAFADSDTPGMRLVRRHIPTDYSVGLTCGENPDRDGVLWAEVEIDEVDPLLLFDYMLTYSVRVWWPTTAGEVGAQEQVEVRPDWSPLFRFRVRTGGAEATGPCEVDVELLG